MTLVDHISINPCDAISIFIYNNDNKIYDTNNNALILPSNKVREAKM